MAGERKTPKRSRGDHRFGRHIKGLRRARGLTQEDLAERAVLVFHRELAVGIRRHKVDFAGGKVGDVRRRALAQSVRFLRLLSIESESRRQHPAVLEREVDIDLVRLGERQV